MSDVRRETIATVRQRLSDSSLDSLPALIQEYLHDDRTGIVAALKSAQRRLSKHQIRLRRHQELQIHERPLWDAGFDLIAGVDEVGRGALAGPLVAAAVALDSNTDDLISVDDSKVMTPEARESAFTVIHGVAHSVSVCIVSNQDIDRYGVGVANNIGLSRAVADLNPPPDYVLIDAFKVDTEIPSMSIIKGDSKSLSIAAASVVAKVTRDRLMQGLDADYPGFDLASNKGYGSQSHMKALSKMGPSSIHRLSFVPSNGTQMSLDL